MRTQGEHIRTLQRRVAFLKAREHRNSYDQAELGALEWALVNLPPAQRTWVGLTDEEVSKVFGGDIHAEHSGELRFIRAIEAKLKERNQ